MVNDHSEWRETTYRKNLPQKPKKLAKLTVKVCPEILKVHRRVPLARAYTSLYSQARERGDGSFEHFKPSGVIIP